MSDHAPFPSHGMSSPDTPEPVFQDATEGIAVADLQGRLTMVSPGALQMLGFGSEAELLGRSFLDLVATESQAQVQHAVEESLRGSLPAAFHLHMQCRDGRQLACEARSTAIRAADGAPQAVLITARDVSTRRLAADELRRSEARYRLLFDANPQPMWVYDLETLAFLAVNDAAVSRYGYSRAEFLRMTIADIRPAEDVPLLIEDVAHLPEGRYAPALWRHLKKDGMLIDVEITSHVFQFDERRARLVHALDVTERLRADARVRQITRLYALLSQVNQAIVRIQDRDRLFSELCRVAVEYGQFRMAWIGLVDPDSGEIQPVVHAGHEEGYLDAITVTASDRPTGWGPSGTAVREGRLATCEDFATDPHMEPWRDEALRRGYCSSSAVPFLLSGRVVGLLNLYASTPSFFSTEEGVLISEIGNDISFALESMEVDRRRRAAERSLRASEARLEHLMAASPATIYSIEVVGDRLEHVWVSRNIRNMLGYEPDEARERAWWLDRVHAEDRERASSGMQRLFADDRLVLDYRFRGKDGNYRWIMDELVLLRDEAGQPREVIGAWTDVTGRRQAEEERLHLERKLLHTQKLESLGVLAGGIAHDFNNLLMAIIGHIELAMHEPPAPTRDHLQQASRAAHIAADLTRQMLAYTGRGRFIIEPIDVNELVQENAQFMRASIAKTVTLEVHLAASLPPIEADAGQVQQVIMNLVTNAADAVSEFGGRITVTTGLEAYAAAALQRSRVDVVPVPGVFVFLDVHDDGCGMDAATQERLFDPFFTTKSTGRGLGMSAILGIVHAHKGAIFVDSAPRQGTTFRVLFPACEADIPLLDVGESRPPGAALAKGGALRGTVLFVDDEAMIRDVGSMMLEHLGLKVLMAANGAEAVDLFRRRAAEIDCVLLDLSMPHMDGLAAMAELMRIRPTARVILSSGYDEQESVRRVPGGAVAFIQKPYTLDNLRKVLEETLLHPVD